VTGDGQRSARGLLIAVLVPVVILVGVLASAVLGHGGSDDRALTPRTATAVATAPPAAAAPPAAPPPVAPPAPPAVTAPPPLAPVAPPPVTAPEPESVPKPVPEPLLGYVPDGAERVDVGGGAQGAAIFRAPGAASRPGPVVIFLHGWVAVDPERYGPWIGHLVRGGATVIYPAYQTKPAYDTIAPLANVLAGVRAALGQVDVAPGRLVAAGHSAGGALAADYAAVAVANGLPAPAAVFSVYPGRKLRHLTIPIPAVNLTTIAPGTRVLVFAGERDTAVGSATAKRIVSGATQADASLQIIRDDAVDEHSAPRRSDGVAQQTFWKPLDALVAATAHTARSGSATSGVSDPP
jgi:acetyl esterase/lipase